MRKPSIHLNGTGADALIAQYEAAGSALLDALEALRHASPNGRDYYVQGPDAANAAAREHESRITRVKSVLDEIRELHEHVADVAGA